MRANISNARRLPDPTDAEIANAVEGYASERELVEQAKKKFDELWAGLNPAHRILIDGFEVWKAFKEGYLGLARELGYLPAADVQSDSPNFNS